MSGYEKKFTPTIESQKQLKVQVPNTPEGRDFLEKLKELLSLEHLPFVQSCPAEPRHAPEGATAHTVSGSTTYALDLRLEQEGWPP